MKLLQNICTAFILTFSACSSQPSPPLSPADQQKTFQLAPGLRIELVASEPMVQDPVAMAFDEDGRLWVVEMRGFMPDIDGVGEDDPVGRVSVLTDEDGDGQMDHSVVFLDSLVLPRAIAIVAEGVLIAEKYPLWLAKDLDGDLKADHKVLIDSTYGESGLIEHSPNGLWRGLDNWYYNAKSSHRYRPANGQWIKQETEFRGQWGISHDNYGRLYYNYNWSQLHADLVPPNYFNRNPHHTPTTGIDHGLTLDRRIYPIRENPAVNRGYIEGTLDSTGRLKEFTSASAPLVYRGTALPDEFQGNVFVCEPAGNLVKRNLVAQEGLALVAQNAYPGKEFLASTDERFRPVSLASGPDGALYVVDMYRGLIEHGLYISEYLREQTLLRNLDKPINRGRIWRIVPEDWTATPQVMLTQESSHDLVKRLSHPDGWHRDMAQRLLIERRDSSILSDLEDLVLNGENPLGRLHGLWTLEGLDFSSSDLLYRSLNDPHPQMRVGATRQLEDRARDDKELRLQLQSVLAAKWPDESAEMILQTTLASILFEDETAFKVLGGIALQVGDSALIRDGIMSSLANRENAFLNHLIGSHQWENQNPAGEILFETLASAIARKNDPEQMKSLIDKLDPGQGSLGWQQRAILSGMALQGMQEPENPIQLSKEPLLFSSRDKLDLSVQTKVVYASHLFNWPGKESIQPADLGPSLDETGRQQFALGRQYYLTGCAACHGTSGQGLKRFGPPLLKSEWVLGDEKRLALLLLHGIEGPINVNGQLYDIPDILPVMPSHSTLADRDIEAIMTYIRNGWGHHAGAVEPRTVGGIRVRSQGRVQPWTETELNQYVEQSQTK